MPANRMTALLRSIADYRVEACFLAALVFTLGHNAYHQSASEVRTTTTHETVVHEVVPVRVAEARRATHIVHRPEIVGIAVPTPRAHVAGDRKIVVKRGSDAIAPCAGSESSAAGGVEGATCKLVRVAPAAATPVVAKAFGNGG